MLMPRRAAILRPVGVILRLDAYTASDQSAGVSAESVGLGAQGNDEGDATQRKSN